MTLTDEGDLTNEEWEQMKRDLYRSCSAALGGTTNLEGGSVEGRLIALETAVNELRASQDHSPEARKMV